MWITVKSFEMHSSFKYILTFKKGLLSTYYAFYTPKVCCCKMREECRNIQSLLPLLTALFYLRHNAAGLEIKRSIIEQIKLAKSPPRRRWRPFCLCANLCKRVLLQSISTLLYTFCMLCPRSCW